MFKWDFHPETNGIILTAEREAKRLQEIAPVYATELHLFGVGEALGVPAESGVPLAWSYRGSYYYRGRKFARRREADVEILDNPLRGETWQPCDLAGIADVNRAQLDFLEGTAAAALDAVAGEQGFVVAYSGGKDSEALLLLALRNAPQSVRKVFFADTTLEFSETLRHVETTAARLARYGIALEKARPYIDALTGWRLFGVPSRNCRWCCQTCKSGALARIRTDGLPVVMGARGSESKYRAGYSLQTDRRRQLTSAPTFRPLFDWNGAEIWAYLLAHGAPINPVYRYGHHRACCAVCPFSSPFEVEISKRMAANRIAPFREEYERQFPDLAGSFDHRYHGDRGTWSRRNAQMLRGDFPEKVPLDEGVVRYIMPAGTTPNESWQELARGMFDTRFYRRVPGEYIAQNFTRPHTSENRLAQSITNRAFFCVGCGYCANYCPVGCLHVEGGSVQIEATSCTYCGECARVECLRASALRGYHRGDGGKKSAK